jgi:Lar family restriction alleviation protein
MITDYIKPCPFCGGKAEVSGCNKGSKVECRDCGASTKYHLDGIETNDTSMKMAIEAWNKRNA